MNDIHVYAQYFAASAEFAGIPRRAAAVFLTASSAEGNIRYALTVTFFPHENAEDFGISYDAAAETVLYEARGRRSKKREQTMLGSIREKADVIAAELGGRIFWDQPLIEARFG